MIAGRAVRLYCLVLGAGLLLEGAGLLLLQALSLFMGDVLHNTIHAAWGIAILALVTIDRSTLRATQVALTFGVFYVGLGILGVLTSRPFGLQLGPGENAFHFTVGPLALVLGAWSAAYLASSRTSSSASKPSISGSTPSS